MFLSRQEAGLEESPSALISQISKQSQKLKRPVPVTRSRGTGIPEPHRHLPNRNTEPGAGRSPGLTDPAWSEPRGLSPGTAKQGPGKQARTPAHRRPPGRAPGRSAAHPGRRSLNSSSPEDAGGLPCARAGRPPATGRSEHPPARWLQVPSETARCRLAAPSTEAAGQGPGREGRLLPGRERPLRGREGEGLSVPTRRPGSSGPPHCWERLGTSLGLGFPQNLGTGERAPLGTSVKTRVRHTGPAPGESQRTRRRGNGAAPGPIGTTG